MNDHDPNNMDLWTDEQEIALLKAVVKWKPVGLHKHFRMLAIHDYMSSQGVINPSDEHTKISGVWQKLGTLYNLPILDEREDSVISDVPGENGAEVYCPFSLPEKEYGALMFKRRLDPNRSISPAVTTSRRESTVADTDEAASSPAPGRRSGRNARAGGAAAKGSRVSKLQNEIDTPSRRSSKAASPAGPEDETMDDAAAVDEDVAESGSEDEDESDEDDGEESVKGTPRAKPKGGRVAAKKKTPRARPGKRRGGRRR